MTDIVMKMIIGLCQPGILDVFGIFFFAGFTVNLTVVGQAGFIRMVMRDTLMEKD